MKKAVQLSRLVAVVFLSTSASQVFAQSSDLAVTEPSDQSVFSTDEHAIVVTARKREERLQDVPLAISAFSADDLQEKGIANSGDLFAQVPNLSFVPRGALAPIPTIRGVYSGVSDPTSEPSIGFYVDDVYISAANQVNMNLLDVEQVEVLRGPQGTIYGKNSLGGAVRITTRKPTNDFSASGRFSYGNRNLIDASASISGPIIPDLLYARIGAALRQNDGYLYNDLLDRKVEYENYKGVAFSLRATPGALTIDLAVDMMRSKPSAGNQETFESSFLERCRSNPLGVVAPGCPTMAAGFGYTPNIVPFDGIVTGDIESRQDQKGEGASLAVNYDLGDMEIVSVTGYRHFQTWMEESRDGSPFPIVAPFSQDYESKAWSQELRLSSTGSGPLQWTVGAYGFWDKRDLSMIAGSARPGVFTTALSAALVPMFPAGSRFALFNQMLEETTDLDSSSLAVFGQATYEFAPRLSLTAGGRYTWEKRDISLVSVCDGYQCPRLSVIAPDGTIFDINARAVAPLVDSAKENVFTPLVTLSWKATDDLMLYGTMSKGFKSGGYAPVFTFAVRPFESESAWNYELGLKSSWLDNRLTLNLSAFYVDWKDVQINSFSQTGGFVIQNAPGGKNKGFEIELAARPTKALSIGGAYGYLDSKYSGHLSPVCTSTLTAQCSIEQSLRRGYVPKHSLSLYAAYEAPISDNWSFTMRADYALKTDILFRVDTIGTAADPKAVNTGRLLRSESYDLVNARIGLKSENWGVAFWAKNLFNEDYYTQVGSFAGAVDAAYGLVGEPRTYGIEVTTRF